MLDQFLTNIQDDVKEVAIHPPVSSNDHSSVVLKLNFKHVRNYSYTRNVWFYAEADFDGFRHALSSVEWDECFQHDDINLVYDTWCNKLLEIAKQFIPNRTITIRLGDKPWYSNELRLSNGRRIEHITKRNNSIHQLTGLFLRHSAINIATILNLLKVNTLKILAIILNKLAVPYISSFGIWQSPSLVRQLTAVFHH